METYGGQTMWGALRRVLVCTPAAAGWPRADGWSELGYFHEPRADEASEQHARLVSTLRELGAEVVELESSSELTLDAVYAHDVSFPTDHGMILMRPGKASRRGESDVHHALFDAAGIPVLGAVEPPGLSEGGDILWLDEHTLMIGEGYRTNAEGIAQIRELVAPYDVDVIVSPLPYGPGPDACLHLMSLISILDERVAIVDLPWLSVSTVRELENRGFDLIAIENAERDSLACNVLALGNRALLAIEENAATNARLVQEGFDVVTYPGSEISLNGSGGPTCLTRPILRAVTG